MLRSTLIFLGESKFARAVVTKTPLRRMSKRFVPGETVESFVEAAKAANARGLKVTGNFLGEAEHDLAGAQEAAGVYLQILDAIVEHKLDANISIKPTLPSIASHPFVVHPERDWRLRRTWGDACHRRRRRSARA